MPAELHRRYLIDESSPISVAGDGSGEADVYRATERATGRPAVVKHYVAGRTPAPAVWEHLRRLRRGLADPYLLRVLEAGTAAGRSYEVSEFVDGGHLFELPARLPEITRIEPLRQLVTQLATALGDLHDHGIVHGDVKPGNILIRFPDPAQPRRIEPVLIDFGTAVARGTPPVDATWLVTPAYQPPEWRGDGLPGPPADWWGLGRTVLELIQGYNPFDGFDSARMAQHFATALVDLAGIDDRQLRQLCAGLLTRDPFQRWGRVEVGRWIERRGADLPPTPLDTPTQPPDALVDDGYPFAGYLFRNHVSLRQAMTRAWDDAVAHLFAPGSPHLAELARWLDQFGEMAQRAQDLIPTLPGSRATDDVRLLRLLEAIARQRPPVYRNATILPRNLARLAMTAILEPDGTTAAGLRELWVFRLLDELAQPAGDEPDAGDAALLQAQGQWQAARGRWLGIMRRQRGRPRELMRRQLRGGVAAAVWLLAARAGRGESARAELDLQRELRRMRRHRADVAWFARLAEDPDRDGQWVAWSLLPEAQVEADQIRRRRETERNTRILQYTVANVRTWTRRRQMPLALGWAVAGTAALAALWMMLLLLSDLVGWVGPSTIDAAWFVAAGALAATLGIESTLAVVAAESYERTDSVFGAVLLALSPTADRARRNGLAAFAGLLVAVGLVVGVALLLPAAVPAGTVVLLVPWAVLRYRQWRERDVRARREDEEAARAWAGRGGRDEQG
jgi:tRNA A-37 threonylcarbamoyl transferase component Bud32